MVYGTKKLKWKNISELSKEDSEEYGTTDQFNKRFLDTVSRRRNKEQKNVD